LAFQVDISAGVAHCSVETGVPHPLTNGCEIDTRFEQGDGSSMPQGMRVNALVAKRGSGSAGESDVLAQQVPYSEARQLLSASIGE
jgi:hypothetical protein